MDRAGHGSIINISSGSARFGIRALTAYCVAKGGLEALTRAMAQELAPKIRVNAIALGSFATDGLQSSLDLMPGSLEKMQENTVMSRISDGLRYICARVTVMRRTQPSMSTVASTRTTRRCRSLTTEPGLAKETRQCAE
jgi:NAD(P)-dependent dehydrogenase (short-subunit alcohol dehydrogenase family)